MCGKGIPSAASTPATQVSFRPGKLQADKGRAAASYTRRQLRSITRSTYSGEAQATESMEEQGWAAPTGIRFSRHLSEGATGDRRMALSCWGASGFPHYPATSLNYWKAKGEAEKTGPDLKRSLSTLPASSGTAGSCFCSAQKHCGHSGDPSMELLPYVNRVTIPSNWI